MKYVSMALLILVLGLGTGCNYINAEKETSLLHDILSTNSQLYFNAGYICAMCEQMKEHPENFKDGTTEKMKDKCPQFKDFETFHKLLQEGNIHE
jgi:hypothetical protein